MSSNLSILLINGPNLNLLGTREPGIYGADTLPNVVARSRATAENDGVTFADFQSNHEGAIIDRIQQAGAEGVDAIVINPGAFTHTSVAIRDALTGTAIPFIEVHVSNIHARETWRHHSYFTDKAVAIIAGLGTKGYDYAINFVITNFKKRVVG
ncbi:catabolic 3-dehydroquinase 1 [Collybia nuda]|uniref:Catabolic 3-dehydroquinase n=1 Tax=Collybia nuda TaxID=64659 RepID=A0A9P5XS38_9AGAR|nr:catabolic 3-dehydroquinase 1 [Collybia nuda]